MENKKRPFFSVVIPTKNRPDYLKDAIQSVLRQDFDDYELIVSDNFNEEPTQNVIASFNDHPKFVSYRTEEELNMISHWEFATKKATGKYVVLLADRKVLYQGALKTAHQYLNQHPEINAFSFGVRMYDEVNHQILDGTPFSLSCEIIPSKELIRNFLDVNLFQRGTLDHKLPKTLNGCYKNDYAKAIRDKYDVYFNTHGVTTPDFSSLFINLSLNDHIGYIDHPMILTQGEQVSNGRNFGKGKIDAYMNSLGLSDPYKEVPIKGPFIYSMLYSDYIVIRDKFNGNLSKEKLNWPNYYATNKYELNRKMEVSELPESIKKEFEQEYNAAFSKEDDQLKEAALKLEHTYERAFTEWNRGTPKKSVMDYVQGAKRKITTIPLMKQLLGKKYKNVMQAANFSKA